MTNKGGAAGLQDVGQQDVLSQRTCCTVMLGVTEQRCGLRQAHRKGTSLAVALERALSLCAKQHGDGKTNCTETLARCGVGIDTLSLPSNTETQRWDNCMQTLAHETL